MDAKRWATTALKRLASEIETKAIVAIGSAVRGAHHSRSDVDFLAITGSKLETESLRPMDVDLRIFSAAEVDERINACDDLLGWALRFGRVAFERGRYWMTLRARWKSQLPLPSPEVSAARALRYRRFAEELLGAGDFDAALEQVIGMLTHQSRATLLGAQVYPASRPELPGQLRKIGERGLAEWLETALQRCEIAPGVLAELRRCASASREFA